jgi:hypothetical protein
MGIFWVGLEVEVEVGVGVTWLVVAAIMIMVQTAPAAHFYPIQIRPPPVGTGRHRVKFLADGLADVVHYWKFRPRPTSVH